jgi:hypothetical protein
MTREYAVTCLDLKTAAASDVARFSAPTGAWGWDIRAVIGGTPGTGEVLVFWQRDIPETAG